MKIVRSNSREYSRRAMQAFRRTAAEIGRTFDATVDAFVNDDPDVSARYWDTMQQSSPDEEAR